MRLIELGGDATAPVLNIALANGFVPQTYLPLLQTFMSDYRVVCMPPRALWGDQTPPPTQQARDWRQLADDLLDGIHENGFSDLIAVGHSFGGVASMLAAIREPQHFRALILLDPTFLPQNLLDGIAQLRTEGNWDAFPLARRASNRQRDFADVDAAFDYFRGKELFEQWSDEVLRLYAEYGTQPTDDGKRTLWWTPEWEALYFSTGYTGIWADVPKLNGLLPTLIIRGGTSNTLIPESAEMLRQLVPAATHTTIDGHGHLFPHSAPQATAQIMQTWLQGL